MRQWEIPFWVTLLAVGYGTVMAFAQPPAPAPAVPSCESQLGEAQTQNATVVQLYRDINQQRGGYEVQMAAIRAALGQDCPEAQPVSQCVAALKAKTAPKPAPAPPAAAQPR